jgi:hypothetical protein
MSVNFTAGEPALSTISEGSERSLSDANSPVNAAVVNKVVARVKRADSQSPFAFHRGDSDSDFGNSFCIDSKNASESMQNLIAGVTETQLFSTPVGSADLDGKEMSGSEDSICTLAEKAESKYAKETKRGDKRQEAESSDSDDDVQPVVNPELPSPREDGCVEPPEQADLFPCPSPAPLSATGASKVAPLRTSYSNGNLPAKVRQAAPKVAPPESPTVSEEPSSREEECLPASPPGSNHNLEVSDYPEYRGGDSFDFRKEIQPRPPLRMVPPPGNWGIVVLNKD